MGKRNEGTSHYLRLSRLLSQICKRIANESALENVKTACLQHGENQCYEFGNLMQTKLVYSLLLLAIFCKFKSLLLKSNQRQQQPCSFCNQSLENGQSYFHKKLGLFIVEK